MLDIDRTRSRLAVPDSVALELESLRSSSAYADFYATPEPLVSIPIATYNRAGLLVDRSLRSLLDQDYTNLEIIVMGDGCTDDTEARVRALGDDRISYVSFTGHLLPPALSRGCEAANLALTMVTGDLITHLDDDDEYTPDRVGKLVRFLQESRAEFVWHPFWWQEREGGDWTLNEAESFMEGKVTTGSVMYLSLFKRVPWDPFTTRYGAPADWVRYTTMRDLGARTVRYPEPLLRHYKEGLNPRWEAGSAVGFRDDGDAAAPRHRVTPAGSQRPG